MFEARRRRLRDLSPIRTNISSVVLTKPEEPQCEALVVSYFGVFGGGEDNQADVTLMRTAADTALRAWPCEAFLFDFRALDVQSVAGLEEVLAAGWPCFVPRLVITSPRCHAALVQLIRDEMNDSPSRWLRDSYEAALADCRTVALQRGPRACAVVEDSLGPGDGDSIEDWLIDWAENHPARDVRSKALWFRRLFESESNRADNS